MTRTKVGCLTASGLRTRDPFYFLLRDRLTVCLVPVKVSHSSVERSAYETSRDQPQPEDRATRILFCRDFTFSKHRRELSVTYFVYLTSCLPNLLARELSCDKQTARCSDQGTIPNGISCKHANIQTLQGQEVQAMTLWHRSKYVDNVFSPKVSFPHLSWAVERDADLLWGIHR